jgi:MFS family permease
LSHGPAGADRSTFRSLRTRNYRLFFIGQTASQIGTWAQAIALGWLVLDLSDNSGLAVGTVTALVGLPTLVLGLWGGVAADRWDKRMLLLGAQVVQGLASGVLAVVVLTDSVQLWMVFVLAFVSGLAQAVDNPTRNAFIPELVADHDVANAIGLNGAIAQSARIVGPALAGALIVWVGTGICFALDSASFLAVIGALLLMRPADLHGHPPTPRAPGQIRAGLAYAWTSFDLRSGLLIMVLLGTFGLNWGVVFPLLAKVTFGTNAAGFSLMTSAMSIGALGGALFVARRGLRSAPALVWGGVAMGAFVCAAALAPSEPVFLVMLVPVGTAMLVHMGAMNGFLQSRARPDMRGRIMALYSMTIFGLLPIGGPVAGWVGQVVGPRAAFAMGGVSSIAAGLVFGIPLLRHVAAEGPAAASLLGAATPLPVADD